MSDSSKSTIYDPQRPWIKRESDDPAKANWAKEFTDLNGTTAKPIFLRGQMYLGLLRLGTLVVAILGLSLGGFIGFFENYLGKLTGPILELLVFFIGLTLALVFSMISHTRRLLHAGRSIWLILVLPIPLLLSAYFTLGGITAIPAKLEANKAEVALSKVNKELSNLAKPIEDTASDTIAELGEVNDALTDRDEARNAEESAKDEDAPKAESWKDGDDKPARSVRVLEPVSQKDLLSAVAFGFFQTWFLFSLLTLPFTLFYVANVKGKEEDDLIS